MAMSKEGRLRERIAEIEQELLKITTPDLTPRIQWLVNSRIRWLVTEKQVLSDVVEGKI